MHQVDWSGVKAVIFDVDGTLYDQGRLRRLMMRDMAVHYLCRPRRINDINIIRSFRLERDKRAGYVVDDLERAQYEWAAQSCGVPVETVRRVVRKWMYNAPLKYIFRCRYPGINELLDGLAVRSIATAIFSDYPARDKLAAMELSADCYACATDREVNSLKPDPTGLRVITGKLGLRVEDCLFIGDRDDRDGECARRAGMPYLIVNKRNIYKFPGLLCATGPGPARKPAGVIVEPAGKCKGPGEL